MKKLIYLLFGAVAVFILSISIESCSTPSKIAMKDGSTLWGENCMRCHNAPSPADYSDAQWETIGMHMRTRADLTAEEVDKIIAFLKTGN